MLRLLMEELRLAGGVSASREKVINIVKDWWSLEKNVERRKVDTTAYENSVRMAQDAMNDWGLELKNSDKRVQDKFKFFVQLNDHVIERAKYSPTYWEGLRRWTYDYATKGNDIPAEIAVVLLRPEGALRKRGKEKGQEPWQFNKDTQIGAIIIALRLETAFVSLDAAKTRYEYKPNMAMVVASEAIDCSVNEIRGSWHRSRKYYEEIFGQ